MLKDGKLIVIIQARMSSTRLPGKIMLSLDGKPVLQHVVERAKMPKEVEDVIVATTINPEDNEIIEFCKGINCTFSRGSLDDVLSRYYHAARENNADYIIRVTSDCPLVSPKIISELIDMFFTERANGNILDYASNTVIRSYPRGMDCEIFTFAALEEAYNDATEEFQREHVTPYINRQPEKFNLYYMGEENPTGDYRITLDTPADWKLIQEIIKQLKSRTDFIEIDDILELYRNNPEIHEINSHIEQKHYTQTG